MTSPPNSKQGSAAALVEPKKSPREVSKSPRGEAPKSPRGSSSNLYESKEKPKGLEKSGGASGSGSELVKQLAKDTLFDKHGRLGLDGRVEVYWKDSSTTDLKQGLKQAPSGPFDITPDPFGSLTVTVHDSKQDEKYFKDIMSRHDSGSRLRLHVLVDGGQARTNQAKLRPQVPWGAEFHGLRIRRPGAKLEIDFIRGMEDIFIGGTVVTPIGKATYEIPAAWIEAGTGSIKLPDLPAFSTERQRDKPIAHLNITLSYTSIASPYLPFTQALVSPTSELATKLLLLKSEAALKDVPVPLVQLFTFAGRPLDLVDLALDTELGRAKSCSRVLRSGGLPAACLSFFMIAHGKQYIDTLFAPLLKALATKTNSMELDPTMNPARGSAPAAHDLADLGNALASSIVRASDPPPPLLRAVLEAAATKVDKKYPGRGKEGVAALLINCLICPALLASAEEAVPDRTPAQQRALVLLSKCFGFALPRIASPQSVASPRAKKDKKEKKEESNKPAKPEKPEEVAWLLPMAAWASDVAPGLLRFCESFKPQPPVVLSKESEQYKQRRLPSAVCARVFDVATEAQLVPPEIVTQVKAHLEQIEAQKKADAARREQAAAEAKKKEDEKAARKGSKDKGAKKP